MTHDVCFSSWVKWSERHSLAGNQGVYLFGRFEHDPSSGPADPLESAVFYVGVCSKGEGTFKGRWGPFDRGIRHPEKARSNRKRYSRVNRYLDSYGPDCSALYVATLTAEDAIRAFLKPGSCLYLDLSIGPTAAGPSFNAFLYQMYDLVVKYLERRLILLYAREHGCRPSLNKD